MTRILLFANNWGGWKVTEWLMQRHENIVGLVVHPAYNSKFRKEILALANLPPERVIEANGLRDPGTVRYLASLEPDIGVSAFFGYILKPNVYRTPERGVINLHTGYLPHNRGWHPNVYPILDGSPAGVAIHWIVEGIDSGAVLARRKVEVSITDTGGVLHQRLTRELIDLFKEMWPKLSTEGMRAEVQDESIATHHYRRELRALEQIDLEKTYTAAYLIDLIRANTYPPYPGAYFDHDGEKVYLRLELIREGDIMPGALPEWEDLGK